jgi:hypothetical protein
MVLAALYDLDSVIRATATRPPSGDSCFRYRAVDTNFPGLLSGRSRGLAVATGTAFVQIWTKARPLAEAVPAARAEPTFGETSRWKFVASEASFRATRHIPNLWKRVRQ